MTCIAYVTYQNGNKLIVCVGGDCPQSPSPTEINLHCLNLSPPAAERRHDKITKHVQIVGLTLPEKNPTNFRIIFKRSS